jgi:hypothetical protein
MTIHSQAQAFPLTIQSLISQWHSNSVIYQVHPFQLRASIDHFHTLHMTVRRVQSPRLASFANR